MRMKNRVAVITGGGAGIGQACAWEFARAGAAVVIADTDEAAITGLTKAMAIDHGKEGIRVNCICPGYIDAGLAAGYFESQSDPAAARASAGKLHALWRIGQPEEVGRVAVFLASEDASFVTGAAVTVDGGFGSGLPPQG
jgi:meso-butanediol dehydrogenase / (S,S)-butanediol dehydrogenase / diacetyl reductase